MDAVRDYSVFDSMVGRVFAIEDITLGTSQQPFLVRYRGRITREDTAAVYDELSAQLKPLGVTPLFRREGDRQAILIVQGVINPGPSNPWINLVLFVLTLLSVLLTGAIYGLDQPLPEGLFPIIAAILSRGWPFAVSLISILAAHELGHYFVGRYHGTKVTLPYFIPFPFSQFGTMGAFINMKEPPRNRRVLLDIAIAGPLAGVLVSIPVLLIGLGLSKVETLPAVVQQSEITMQLEGNSLIYLLMKYITFGQLLPAPVNYAGLPPLLYWVKFFFTGQPFPLGGLDVMLHPVAWAGWAGLLVTAMNLIPVGQLDGGHMLYVLIGQKRAQTVRWVILVALVALGFIWNGWWLWAAIIFFLGRSYAEPLDQITELDGKRKWLAVLALVLFILVFTPVPLSFM